MNEIWILGATGRSGRAVAAKLRAAQQAPVLVGRDAARLQSVAANIGGDLRTIAADSMDALTAEIVRQKPAVVINTIGPFTATAFPIARACAPGTHYVDISNEIGSFLPLLALHDAAVAAGQTFVTGAGFGVLATESLVLKLCENQPTPTKVRVDSLPFVEVEPGAFGEALAATIVEGMAEGGRCYAGGQLVRTRPASDVQTLTLPDGSRVATAGWNAGDLQAAHRASGAPSVVAASSMVPSAPLVRAVLPAISSLMRIAAVRKFAQRRMAAIEIKAPPEPPKDAFSWAHARVQWESGEAREGWLRLGDATDFTTNVMAEVAMRLARGAATPGAYTPGALFGPQLAQVAGGQFLLDDETP